MSKIIPFNKPTVSKKDLVNVLEAMVEDKLVQGELCRKFELAFSSYLRVKDSLFVSSGEAALYLILKKLELEKNDEIILSAYNDPAIVECLLSQNLKPVLVDVEEKSFLIDKKAILKKISPKTRAIIISHAFGYLFPVDSFRSFLSTEHPSGADITIIEDCRHSLGSVFLNDPQNPHGGSFQLMGDYGFFAFNPDNIITTGYGGAIITKSKKVLSDIKDLRKYVEQDHLKGRLNFSPTELQASMGLAELSLIEKFLNRRREIGSFYLESVMRGKNKFIHPGEKVRFNYGYFPILIHSSLKIAKEMFKKYGVQVIEPIRRPLYQLLGLSATNFPNTLDRHLKTLAVPIYPRLSKTEIESIEKLLRSIR